MRRLFALICLLAAFFIWHVAQQAPPAAPIAVASLSADTPDAVAPPDNSTASEAPEPKPWGSDTAPISTAASVLYLKNHAATPLPAMAFPAMASTDAAADDFTTAGEPLEIPADAGRLAALSRSGVCSTIVSVARANDLPIPFFANLIWQESSFRSKTISPAGALGMAQFIPETAIEHGLMNPFEPVHALFASGKLLRRLHQHFGNLGLAAAAYNAGPQRVHDWMGVRRGLPLETRDYVRRITGHQADRWLSSEFARGPEALLMPARAPCAEVAEAVREQTQIVQVARLMAELAAATAPPPPQDQQRVAALQGKSAGKQAAVRKKTAPAQKPAVAAQAKPQMARAMKDQSRPTVAQGPAKVAPVASVQAKKRIAAQ
jgi:soluble lytic murein transglycosylase-like protein